METIELTDLSSVTGGTAYEPPDTGPIDWSKYMPGGGGVGRPIGGGPTIFNPSGPSKWDPMRPRPQQPRPIR